MMALIFADGFDHYGFGATGAANMLRGQWASLDSSNTVPSSFGRTGGSLYCSNYGARLALRSPMLLVGAGFGMYVATLPSLDSNSRTGFSYYAANGSGILNVTVDNTGALVIKKGVASSSSGEILGITDSVISGGTFNHIEAKVVIDNIVGEIELRFNGTTIFHLDNLNLGTTPITAMVWHQNVYPNAGSVAPYIDDLLIWDDTGDHNNDFMGPQRLLTKFCNGDTAQADWAITGSATGYGAIGEVPQDGDTTYISAETVGDKSEFTLPELPPELASISAVFIPALARADEAGISSLKVSMISGEEILEGGEHDLVPQYSYFRDAYDYDPATGESWTKESFEAAVIRVEKVA